MGLRGIPDRNAAELFRGKKIEGEREDAPALEEGRYYIVDIIGLSCETEEGEVLELPGFTGTAELLIDGASAGKLAFAPYRFPLIPGEHTLQLRCWNSMGNVFERYAAPSGLTAFPEKKI